MISRTTLHKGPLMNRIVVSTLCILCTVACVWATDSTNAQRFDMSELHKNLDGYTRGDDTAAAPTGRDAAAPQENAQSLIWLTVKLCGVLAGVLLLLYVVVRLLKRGGMTGAHGGSGTIDVLEAASLGPQRNLVLVRVLDTVYVLGQTQQQITLLEKIEGEQAMEVISSSRQATSLSRFKDVFDSFLSKHKETASS